MLFEKDHQPPEDGKPKNVVLRTFKALGTVNTIYVPGQGDKDAVDAAARRIMALDDMLSVFKPDSEISKVNAAAGRESISVGDDAMRLLERAVFFSRISGGAFDVTAGPLVDVWGIGTGKHFVPGEGEIEQARSLVGYEDVILDAAQSRAMLRREGQKIDLGGIAKGFAADEAGRVLTEHGVKSALVNLGGNIVAIGKRPDGEPWSIGVQDPEKQTGTYMGTLDISDRTVVTSGANEQFFYKDGVKYHHIIDPRTGYPAVSDLLSVTVVGRCSMDMDALATAVFVEGMIKGVELANRLDAQAVLIRQDGSIFVTKALKNQFHIIYDY